MTRTGRLTRQAAPALAVLAALSGPARAEVTAGITEYGEFRADILGQMEEVYGLSPGVRIGPNRLVRQGTAVEARLCTQLGYVVTLAADPPEDMPETVDVAVRHPRLTRPDGASSTGYSFSSGVGEGRLYAGFLFYYAWELQPGAYTIDVSLRGKLLASKTFTVTVPPDPAQPGAARAGACGPPAVS